jgi:hypothetical protein
MEPHAGQVHREIQFEIEDAPPVWSLSPVWSPLIRSRRFGPALSGCGRFAGLQEATFLTYEGGRYSTKLQAFTPCLAGIYFDGHGAETPPS